MMECWSNGIMKSALNQYSTTPSFQRLNTSAEPRLDYLLSTGDCGMAMIGTCKGGCLLTEHVR